MNIVIIRQDTSYVISQISHIMGFSQVSLIGPITCAHSITCLKGASALQLSMYLSHGHALSIYEWIPEKPIIMPEMEICTKK